MFIMSYGAMVGYLIIIKSNLSILLGVDLEDVAMARAVLMVSSLSIILPLSLERDISKLSKTSAMSVIFDCILVVIVAIYSPVRETIEREGGILPIMEESIPDISTFFIGIGVLCFAFVCQHSAFIIAASLENPTRARWNKVTGVALGTCAVLAIIMGVAGFLGFMGNCDGDILVNLGNASLAGDESFQRASNIARGLLCTTMFFVYPVELFVARHVCVVLFFKGRRAHEGDDHSVLKRKDRRVAVTVFLYIISLVPALMFDDLGGVFSITGSLGGAALSYIGPGILYLAVHGSDFLELASKRWSYVPTKLKSSKAALSIRKALQPIDVETGGGGQQSAGSTIAPKKNICIRFFDCILWYILLMPLWCKVALIGKFTLKKHQEDEAMKSPMPYALGKVIHHKPQYRNLMKPMKGGSFASDDDDDDSVENERKPLIRTFSNPDMKKNVSRFIDTRLPPLPPSRKVGFQLGPSHNPATEKKPLDRSRPITPESFSQASFEVMRQDSSYGATGSGLSIQEQVKEIKKETISDAAASASVSNRSLISELGSSTRSIAESDTDFGLTYDEDDEEDESQGTSVFMTDDDDAASASHHSHISEASSIRSIQFALSSATKQDGRSIQSAGEVQVETDPTLKIVDKLPKMTAAYKGEVKTRTKRTKAPQAVVKDPPAVAKTPSIVVKFPVAVKASPIVVKRNVAVVVEKKEEGEDDPQDNPPSVVDFVVAICYVLFGVVAAIAGLYSSF